MSRRWTWYSLVSTFFGVGYVSAMPGTVGSIAAYVVAMILPIPLWGIALVTVLGGYAAQKYAAEVGREDPGEVVIDEVAGIWLALAFSPPGLPLAALFLFRILDILKPFPIRQIERLPGGIGIMADDLLAGILSALILHGVYWIFYGGGLASLLG